MPVAGSDKPVAASPAEPASGLRTVAVVAFLVRPVVAIVIVALLRLPSSNSRC